MPEEEEENREGVEEENEAVNEEGAGGEEESTAEGGGSITQEGVGGGAVYTFTFPKGKDVRYVFLSLAQVLNEALFTMSPDGISLKAVDSSKVSLVILNIPSTALEEVNITDTVKVGILFDTVKKLARRIRAKDKVDIGVDRGRNRFLMTIYYGSKGKESGMYRRFYLPIVDVAQEDIPEPKIDYPVRIRMSMDAFRDALTMAEDISDAVTFAADPESFVIKASGEGGRYYEVQYQSTDESFQEFSVSERHEASYSLEYITSMNSQMAPICEYVTIEFATNKPIRLTYEFASGSLTYYVAPRAL
ncbi:MAG: DNA polymerase sliding clamp [Caldivirga sp.]|nr:DNA polymerase sliding clamp [Caldivirga sp.]